MLEIFTAIILALAAIFAYLIQRARYIREIEPDLRLTRIVAIEEYNGVKNIQDPWFFNIDIEVENQSNNHACELTYNTLIQIHLFEGDIVIGLPFPDYLAWDEEILARRKITVPIHMELNKAKFASELNEQPELALSDIERYFARIRVKYYTKSELVLFFIAPLRRRLRYERDFYINWKFSTSTGNPPYDPHILSTEG